MLNVRVNMIVKAKYQNVSLKDVIGGDRPKHVVFKCQHKESFNSATYQNCCINLLHANVEIMYMYHFISLYNYFIPFCATVKTITHEVLWMTRCTVARGRTQRILVIGNISLNLSEADETAI